MVFQEPSTALNPVLHGGLADRRGPARARRLDRAEARAKAIERAAPGRHPRPGGPRRPLPAPVLRRAEAAHRHRAWRSCSTPGVIVADEPTTALDVTVQAEILDLLRRCRDEFGTAIVLITHNMGVVADLADRVAVMYQGKIVEQADVARRCSRDPQAPVHAAAARRGAAGRQGLGRAAARRRRRRPTAGAAAGDARRRGARPAASSTPAGSASPTSARSTASTSSIRPGEVLGLVGESRHRQDDHRPGHRRPDPGHRAGRSRCSACEMNGVARARRFRPVRSRIGFVFQDPATSFNPLLTIARVRRRAARGARPGARRRARRGRGWTSCSRPSSCPRPSATGSRTSSPAASASAPAWPGRSRSTRSC